jgi:phospholipid/cholesterol/gamma-HCH transport system substrate-binding protein
MKLSKEIKTGILVTSAILIFFAGFYYLKGSNIFSSQNKYYCYFEDIQGLQVSAIVQIRGMNVGRVASIKLMNNDKRVQVVIEVEKSIKLPKGTIAVLASADLISGTKVINLSLGDSNETVESGATLQTQAEKNLLDSISDDVTPVIESAKVVMTELDSIITGVSDVISAKNKLAINKSLESIQAATGDIAVLSQKLRSQSDHIQNIIANSDKITKDLSKTTDELSKAPIKKTLDEMQMTVNEMQGIVKKINEGQGSLGMMVNDKALYNNINASLKSLDQLMTDLKSHPARYINVTIFGKKKSKDQ